MNTAIITKALTSKVARKVYKQAAKYGAKAVGTIACEVGGYFAAQKIIKGISKKTNFESVDTCTIKIVGA